MAAMALAFQRYLAGRADVDGVIGLGGSGGTALITPAMRALPVGIPKIMVSTVASGDVSRYVEGSDIAMLHSVTDVAGLNRISRRVLGNAAHALAGACSHPIPVRDERPAVGLTMFGVTTPCVGAVTEQLSDRFDCLDATGTGGRAMEKRRDELMAKFSAMAARGEPIEAGGIDLIVIYNSGRFRMAGRGSLAGLLAYGQRQRHRR